MYFRFISVLLLSLIVQSVPEFYMDEPHERSNSFVVNSLAGPFKLLLRRFEDCPREMRGKNRFRLTGTINKTKEYQIPRYYGTFETLEPFDDEVVLHTTVASWNSAHTQVGWVPNAINLKTEQMCSILNTVFKDAVDFIEEHEVNHQNLCPRGVGNFTVKAVPTAYNMKNWIPFRYGRWRADFQWIRDDVRMGCVRSILETVPVIIDD